jgi:hypothetical protein
MIVMQLVSILFSIFALGSFNNIRLVPLCHFHCRRWSYNDALAYTRSP